MSFGKRFTLDMLPAKARAQALAQLGQAQIPVSPDPVIPNALKPMKGQKQKGPNKTELRFQSYLQAKFPDAEVEHEPITLRLANGARYTPDFVIWLDGATIAYEVKGFMREAAAVRIKIAAAKFKGKISFVLVFRDKHAVDGWRMERVIP